MGIASLLCSIVLFSSLGAYIAITFGALILFVFYRKKIKYFFGFVTILVISSLFISLVLFDEIEQNYNQMYKNIDSKEELYFRANRYSESILTRIVVWDIASQTLIKNPLGVGTGDVKDVLIERYGELGLTKMKRQKLNPHNQFLQTGVSIGLIGVLSLISLFLLTFYRGIKTKNSLLSIFSVMIIVNMLFESFLEVQAGIVFTALFLFLLDTDFVKPLIKDKSMETLSST
jgi:O-antigen ligase